jgi:hypothetical protein
MSDLARQQQMLLAALFAWPRDAALAALAQGVADPNGRGFMVYQANGHMLAQRALAGAYPVLAQLLGTSSVAQLARALWHAHPPQRGDVAQWGADLADWISASDQLREEPYLCDVARVEWAMHLAESAPDSEPSLQSLQLLTTQDPLGMALELSAGCMILRSAWPVASLVCAHLEAQPTLVEVAAKLRAGVGQDVVVWRSGLRARAREALAGEYEMLQLLLLGASIASAVDAAADLDFSLWLPMAVQSGLVLGAHRIAASPSP